MVDPNQQITLSIAPSLTFPSMDFIYKILNAYAIHAVIKTEDIVSFLPYILLHCLILLDTTLHAYIILVIPFYTVPSFHFNNSVLLQHL